MAQHENGLVALRCTPYLNKTEKKIKKKWRGCIALHGVPEVRVLCADANVHIIALASVDETNTLAVLVRRLHVRIEFSLSKQCMEGGNVK
jgi:hypothetical protein